MSLTDSQQAQVAVLDQTAKDTVMAMQVSVASNVLHRQTALSLLTDALAISKPISVPVPDPTPIPSTGPKTTAAAKVAGDQLDAMNVRYVLGGGHSTPADASRGLDCSSAASWVMQHAGWDVPTVATSSLLSKWGTILEPWSSSQRGVFVCCHPDPDGSGGRSGHVYLVIGGQKFESTSLDNLGAAWKGAFTIPGGTYTAGTHTYTVKHVKGTS